MRFRLTVGALAAVAVATGASCGPRPGQGPQPARLELALPPAADAPYELAEDEDLAHERDRFEALRPGDPARAELRDALAREYARRVDQALKDDRRLAAIEALQDLAELWTAAEIAAEPQSPARVELAQFAPQAQRVRDTFARSGGDLEATFALLLLREMEPERAGACEAEIDEIFVYDDDLAVARFGEGAQRSRPIEILENAVAHFPSAYAIDRLTRLYIDRQKAVSSLLRRNTGDFGLFRAHGDGVLRTTWHLVRIHALADRLAAVRPALDEVTGVGANPDVRRTLVAAMQADAPPSKWIALVDVFRDRNPAQRDLRAALHVALEGTRRYPKSSEVLATAAEVAKEQGRIAQAIALYEHAFALAPERRSVAEALAELYEIRVSDLVFHSRPRAAKKRLAALEEFHARADKRWPSKPLEHDLADAYASMGRGLVSIGNLAHAQQYLQRSMELRPTQSALEYLGTIDLKQDHFDDAARHFDRALMLPGDGIAEQFSRAKILRLASKAYKGAGKPAKARQYAEAALVAWNKLGERGRFTRPEFNAERLIETGKLLWELDKRDMALRAFERAVDADPDGASTHAAVVAFLVVRDELPVALDAYHRALGNEAISDYFKVYMSLWILSEARRGNMEPDHLATQYLASRHGNLWYDELARFASGRATRDELQRRANTPARRAELLYYLATLAPDVDPQQTRELLGGVIDTKMILFFEYDMAREWLKRGIGGHRNASATPRR